MLVKTNYCCLSLALFNLVYAVQSKLNLFNQRGSWIISCYFQTGGKNEDEQGGQPDQLSGPPGG